MKALLLMAALAQNPVFTEVPQTGGPAGHDAFSDVMSHATKKHTTGSRSTQAHETAHFINADTRNKVIVKTFQRVNAFYVLDGKAIVVKEPAVRKSQAAALVPQSLRGNVYDLYASGNPAWEDQPLYLFDEWSAYLIDTQVDLEDTRAGRPSGEVNVSLGAIELAIYSTALAQAVKQRDPDSWGDPQFQRAYRFLMERTAELYPQAPCEPADKLLETLRKDPQAESLRAVIRDLGCSWPLTEELSSPLR